jgi:hypothetical protein
MSMATDSTLGKKSAFAIASTLSFLALLVAFLATIATMTVNNMSHVGNTASTIVQHLSKDPVAIDSLLSEFSKNADPKTVVEIDKNRVVIDSTLTALGGDREFQNLLAGTLNKISKAILSGSKSVTVDFAPLAAAVAAKVNAAAKSQVIGNKELAKLKPKVLDFSKQARNISDARSKFVELMLIWVLWFVLLGVLYLLKGWQFLSTAGWQLFSVGIVFLAVHYAGPVLVHSALDNSTVAEFQKVLVPEILKSLTSPMMILSIIVLLAGVVLLVANQLLRNRLLSKTNQMSPSVVA